MNKAHLETEGCNSNVTLVGDASRVVYVNFSYRKRALRGVVVAVCGVGYARGRRDVLERLLMQTDKRVTHWLPNKPNSGHGYSSPTKKVAHRHVFVGDIGEHHSGKWILKESR